MNGSILLKKGWRYFMIWWKIYKTCLNDWQKKKVAAKEKKERNEFYFSEDFYPVDFMNHANKPRDDFQYLSNQLNITDWSESITGILDAKIGLKEIKIRFPDELVLSHVKINSTNTSLIL